MKKILILLPAAIFTLSCKEQVREKIEEPAKIESIVVKEVEPSKQISDGMVDSITIINLNKVILEKKLTAVDEILNEYKPKSQQTEGNYSYSFIEYKKDATTNEVTLQEEGLLDDSIEGKQSILIIKTEKGVSKVLSIKESIRCYKGRGHVSWGTEPCN
jgi:hypothetical protein